MKKLILIFAAAAAVAAMAAAVVSTAGCSPARRAARARVQSQADSLASIHVDRMLTARLYKVDVTHAYPLGAPAMVLSYPYYLSVIDNRVESFLPYFGRAWSVPYAGGEGLRFAAPISAYRESVRPGGERIIRFTARTREDRYDFTLSVFPTGRCDLSITPNRKQSISFSGSLDPDPEFELIER